MKADIQSRPTGEDPGYRHVHDYSRRDALMSPNMHPHLVLHAGRVGRSAVAAVPLAVRRSSRSRDESIAQIKQPTSEFFSGGLDPLGHTCAL